MLTPSEATTHDLAPGRAVESSTGEMSSWRPHHHPTAPADRAAPRRRLGRRKQVGLRTPHAHTVRRARTPAGVGTGTRRRFGPASSLPSRTTTRPPRNCSRLNCGSEALTSRGGRHAYRRARPRPDAGRGCECSARL
eukprot:6173180-Pleurochrysis_carterae.AAC.1